MAGRDSVIEILTKLGSEATPSISLERAVAKLERVIGKFNKTVPNLAWTDQQLVVLAKFGATVGEAKESTVAKNESDEAAEESEDEAEEESEAEEKPAKKGKGKKAKDEKPAKKGKGKKAKREGNIGLMARLLAEGKTEKEIEKVFLEIYKAKGQTDKEFIRGRIATYHTLAGGKRKGKKAKDEKPAKKGKKVKKAKAKKEAAEESEDEAEEESED